jgi:hypothetical protein
MHVHFVQFVSYHLYKNCRPTKLMRNCCVLTCQEIKKNIEILISNDAANDTRRKSSAVGMVKSGVILHKYQVPCGSCKMLPRTSLLSISVVIFFWSFGIIDASTIKCWELSTAQAGVRGREGCCTYSLDSIKPSLQF